MKGLKIFLAGAFLFFSSPHLVYSHQHQASSHEKGVEKQGEEKEPIKVNNKICPVSGEEIDEETKVEVEYKGKIYNLCCPMCKKDFLKNPEKYIKKIEELQKENSKE